MNNSNAILYLATMKSFFLKYIDRQISPVTKKHIHQATFCESITQTVFVNGISSNLGYTVKTRKTEYRVVGLKAYILFLHGELMRAVDGIWTEAQ